MGNLELKAKVALNNKPNLVGIIVAVLKGGRYKVLLDRDWETGRTYVYREEELATVN